MSKYSFKFLALIIPNFCLFYAYSWPVLQAMPERREAFGGPDLYLDIKYVGIPRRQILGKEAPEAMEFSGILATDFSESSVTGKRVKSDGNTWYTFKLGDQMFLGRLTQGKTGCEPQLQYRLEKNGKVVKTGSMKAGFCT